jgi:DNA polymerase sigma
MSDDGFIAFGEEQPFACNETNPALMNDVNIPWLRNCTFDKSSNPIQNLHNEILQFCRLVALSNEEMETRESVINELKGIALKLFPDCELKAFGSHVSKILTPMSDLDIVRKKFISLLPCNYVLIIPIAIIAPYATIR